MIRSNSTKPMIMYVEVKDGNVTMTKEMFEKYINEAYQAGKGDNHITWNARNESPSILDTNPYRPITTCAK